MVMVMGDMNSTRDAIREDGDFRQLQTLESESRSIRLQVQMRNTKGKNITRDNIFLLILHLRTRVGDELFIPKIQRLSASPFAFG